VLNGIGGISGAHRPRLVKGSHIVVRRLHGLPDAFTFQSGDGRVVFAIPYEDDFTLIGTTDVPIESSPGPVEASAEEIAYLCAAVSDYFVRRVTPEDVVWSYAGVRPLYDDGSSSASAVTRDYAFDLDAGEGRPPLLSVYGGKLTTHRRLAEHALADLQPHLGFTAGPWTGQAHYPGGDIKVGAFDSFVADQSRRHAGLPFAVVHRLCRAYGTRIGQVLDGGGGELIGGRLPEAELDYLREREWARSAQDVLWRRSKLGLHLSPADQARVAVRFKT
jgi:glycerol-3-phosphate dehydrogenase